MFLHTQVEGSREDTTGLGRLCAGHMRGRSKFVSGTMLDYSLDVREKRMHRRVVPGSAPGMLHDLSDGDSFAGVGCQHAREQVLALVADMQRLLEVSRHYAREHLLQPHQVVPAVVAALRKWQHACPCTAPTQHVRQ